MKPMHVVRVALIGACASLLTAALFIPGRATSTYASIPLNITSTPVAEPSATPRPPTSIPPTRVGPTATPGASVVTPPPPANPFADPAVTLSGCVSTCVQGGDVVEFIAIVTNRGNTPAVNVQLYQSIPPYFELVEVTSSRGTVVLGAESGYLVDIGTLETTDVITVKIKLRYKPGATPVDVVEGVIVRTTSTGDIVANNVALAKCQICQVVLPVTGAENNARDTFAVLLVLMGATLATSGRYLRRKTIR